MIIQLTSATAELGKKINLHTEVQLPRLPGSRNASFRHNPIFYFILWGGVGGHVTPIFPFIFLIVGSK